MDSVTVLIHKEQRLMEYYELSKAELDVEVKTVLKVSIL